MPLVMQQFLGYCFSGSLITIPFVIVLWVAGQKRLASIVTFVCMVMATALTVGLIAGLPELLDWIPTGTIVFPKGYQSSMFRKANAFYMGNLLWAMMLTLSMYGLWRLRKE